MSKYNVENWSARWTNVGTNGNTRYLGIFSCSTVNTNVIYTIEQAQEILSEKVSSNVPHQVLVDALTELNISCK